MSMFNMLNVVVGPFRSAFMPHPFDGSIVGGIQPWSNVRNRQHQRRQVEAVIIRGTICS